MRDLVIVQLLPEKIRSLHTRDRRIITRYEGPILIIAKIKRASYKVVTPSWMKVHPVFHINNPKPYHLDIKDEERNQPTS